MKLSAPLHCGAAALAAAVIGPFAQAGTIHVPADAPSLSAAIALAQDGDEIVVADGTWKGPANRDLEIEGKDLVVRGENGAAQCIIDCEHKARALYLDDCGPDTVIEGLSIRHGQVGTGSATSCDVQGGFAGAGNIAVDPQFVDLAGGDLRLASGSPCIDVGPHGALPYGGFTDLDHASRLLDGDLDGALALDMGAYERTNVALKVSGLASPGSTLTLDVSGTAGLQYVVGVGASLADPPLLVGGLGYALVTVAHPWRIAAGPGLIPATATLTISASAPPGTTFFLQPVAWDPVTHAGNFGAPATIALP